jgi:branched-chain amino acid transport system substrate-binding protein
MKSISYFFGRFLLLAALPLSALAEDGVSKGEILVGMSNALSGPSSALGTGMKAGAEAFFKKLNAGGGVNGRKVKLISLDDGYEPENTVKNTEKLINESKVFTLFGYVGTPTSVAVMPLVGKNKIPYVAPFTGAEAIRNPVNPQVFNVRSSYFDETEGLVEHFKGGLGITKIGVFVQDDAYGAAGEAGVRRALSKRDLQMVGRGVYKRNTVDIDGGYAEVKKAAPDAVVLVGTYKACAAFAKKAKADGWNVKIANVSFVGTAALIKEMGKDGDGVFISQVLPSPSDASTPVVKEYQRDMKAAGQSALDYTSLEGYVGAKVLAEGLKNAGAEPTRDSFRAALESMKYDVGGLEIAFSPTNHNGNNRVWFTVVKGGKAVPVTSFK